MKIKTVEKLEDLIDKDLAWRKKELLDIKRLISRKGSNKKLHIRAGFALLSANFEGFIKYAANMYIVFVSCQKIPYCDIKNCFLSIRFQGKFDQCTETERLSVYTSLLDNVQSIQTQHFKVSDEKVIKTESNPSSKVLKEILISIGLEHEPFESKNHFIDYSLLSNRHKVVHGEVTSFEPEDFFETLQEILETMNLLREKIFEAAANKKYLKSPQLNQVG
ncbi:MAE_28990/MAE_18760 family HEPN-like nuclease [Paenibacillus sp. FSL R7-0333]|uniref:MAE_28990/MAE_18760 family HEPN-like nuclease n=1 Tax=Paenibacillus sp. FSL R7-0333 TaxID=1926587 RepID=UPI00096D9438|nr:hypothetical protein BK146_28330 [Paenibacillus sp. FSL R7-0333]